MNNVIAINFKTKKRINFDCSDKKNHNVEYFEFWVLKVGFDYEYNEAYKEYK